jgi:hypothetical protein
MTPEAQRIAIAKACPHLVEKHDGVYYWKGSWSSVGEGNEHFAVLEPLNDLNAMHEAEKTLSRNQRAEYWHEIIKLCNQDARLLNDFDRVGIFYQLHATAAQRAEAFLRTIEKWEESA